MPDNVLRAYRAPVLESLEAGPILGQYRVGMNDAINEQRRNLLRQAGEAAVGGDLDAASRIAMAGGDLETGLKLQNTFLEREDKLRNMSLEQRKNALEFMTRAAAAADTPEKWAQLNRFLESQFGRGSTQGFNDFSQRDLAISLAMTALQRETLEMQRRAAAAKPAQTTLAQDAAEREAAVISRGLDPKSPNMQSFILSGNMPRENQLSITPTDKKAILEAEDIVLSSETAQTNLNKAKEISKKAYSGPMAATRGYYTSLTGSESGLATVDLNNLVTGNALEQLKATFGGAPTEGERKILLEVQGSANLPDKARQEIYDRALVAVKRRLEMNKRRVEEMREGTYFKPGNRTSPAPAPEQNIPTPPPAITPPPSGFRQIVR